MSVYITSGGATYDDIKSLSFVPEIDPTMSTLPICEYSVEIVTSVSASAWKNRTVSLYETGINSDILLAGSYTVFDAEQLSPKVVRITAASYLRYLEKRTLPAQLYSNMPLNDFLIDICEGDTIDSTADVIIWDDDEPPIRIVNIYGAVVSGLFPVQTARERLQMLCQANNYWVLQWGEYSEYGIAIINTSITSFNGGTLINPENTYYQPKTKKLSDTGTVKIAGHYDASYTYHEQTDTWKKYVIQQGWTDPDTGLSADEIAVYYREIWTSYSAPQSESENPGVVEINNLCIANYSSSSTLLTMHFAHYQTELDVLCWPYSRNGTLYDRRYFPGDMIQYYADNDTVYSGVITSAEFVFGTMTREKLKILTDAKSINGVIITVNYVYGGKVFQTKHLNRSSGTYTSVYIPYQTTIYDGTNIRRVRLRNYTQGYWLGSAATSPVTYNFEYVQY